MRRTVALNYRHTKYVRQIIINKQSTIRLASVGPARGSHFKVHLGSPHPVLVEVELSVAAVDATMLSPTPHQDLVEVGLSVAAVDATMLSPTPHPSSSGGGAQCSSS